MIPTHLWTRLRALDRRCDIEMHRLDTAEGGRRCTTERNYPPDWRVVIRDRIGQERRTATGAATGQPPLWVACFRTRSGTDGRPPKAARVVHDRKIYE